MGKSFDAIVIGGGFYGLQIALHLRRALGCRSVLVLEREEHLMRRASYVNQARVHNGYHYPRSLLTGSRSRASLPIFADRFKDAIVDSFTHYYAIPRRLSKTSPKQFEVFCSRIGAVLMSANEEEHSWFNSALIKSVYVVEEPAFDSRRLLEISLQQLSEVGGVEVETANEVLEVGRAGDQLRVVAQRGVYLSSRVVNATYAGINQVLERSSRPVFAIQHELAEMALVRLEPPLQSVAVTVMDGPFFSLVPFPGEGVHTLSHVRYTPHTRWRDQAGSPPSEPYRLMDEANRSTLFPAMLADATRYMPALKSTVQVGSLWEVKTVLAASDHNDSRPILFRPDSEWPGFVSVLGGKIDNIFDVLTELERHYAAN